jgi:Na+/H+ antiporter NhaC
MTGQPDVHRKKCSLFVQWFDILFIMVLCFLTLLSTMLMRGKVLVGSGTTEGLDYSFGWLSFALVLLFLIAYLIYMIMHSERELREMINHVYSGKTDCENIIDNEQSGIEKETR